MNSSIDSVEIQLGGKAALIEENRKRFAAVGKAAAAEFDGFAPCEKCKFLKPGCWKTCGVRMKHLWKASETSEHGPGVFAV